MDELKLFSVLSINIITAGEYLLHHPEKLIFILNPENLTTSLQSRQGEKNHQWFRETQSSQIQNCYKLFCTEFNKKKIIFCVFPWSHIMSTSTNPVISYFYLMQFDFNISMFRFHQTLSLGWQPMWSETKKGSHD